MYNIAYYITLHDINQMSCHAGAIPPQPHPSPPQPAPYDHIIWQI